MLGALFLFAVVAVGLFFCWNKRARWRELAVFLPHAGVLLLALVIVYLLLTLSFGGLQVRLL